MSGVSETLFKQQDQAERVGILGYAPADDVRAFVASILPDLGQIEVISVQTGLLNFGETPDSDNSPRYAPVDLLVTEAHVLLAGMTDGYSAVFGGDTLHAIAVAILDAALRAEVNTEAHLALQRNIERFIDAQAALLAQVDEQALPQAGLLPA